MPIINNLFNKYKNTNIFFESGSHVGSGIQRALSANFDKIISVELSPDYYYYYCLNKFKNNDKVCLYHGDTEDIMEKLISEIDEPITFWLDGHYSGGNTSFGKHESPLMQELEIIKNHRIKTHTLIIDDMRCWEKPRYDFDKDDIINFIKSINKDYEITYEDGHEKNDILIAVVKNVNKQKYTYNLCTLSDEKYILKGLVLYDSLYKKNENFILHYLCLDQKIFEILNNLNLDKIRLYKINDLISNDDELKNLKNSSKYNHFCWSMASYFCRYLLNEGFDDILYIDSDIIFYYPVENIYNEIGDKSIGIIRHRNVPPGHKVGEYNVGIVYFKGDEKGKDCCNFWWELVSGKNQNFPEYGTCGDQKYLELFPRFYTDNLCIIDNIGHAAPFNFDLYDYSLFNMDNKKIIYQNKEQYIVFCHFMKFLPIFGRNSYFATDELYNQEFMKIPQVKKLYDEYFEISRDINQKYLKNK